MGKPPLLVLTLKTHVVGIFGSRLEVPFSSPYTLLQRIPKSNSLNDVVSVAFDEMASHYHTCADTAEVKSFQQSLTTAFEDDAPDLKSRYATGADAVADMFEQYFETQ